MGKIHFRDSDWKKYEQKTRSCTLVPEKAFAEERGNMLHGDHEDNCKDVQFHDVFSYHES